MSHNFATKDSAVVSIKHGADFISVMTDGGVRKVTVEEYLRLVQAWKPDLFVAPADMASGHLASAKICRRSVDRTLNYLDQSIILNAKSQIPLFAPITGGHVIRERVRNASESSKRDKHLSGYVIDGISATEYYFSRMTGMPTSGTELVHSEVISTIYEKYDILLRSTLEVLPKEKLRLLYGFGTPDLILRSLTHGVDLFDLSFPLSLSDAGYAINIYFPTSANPNELQKMKINTDILNLNLAKHKSDETGLGVYADYEDLMKEQKEKCSLNLAQWSRAYVYHLLDSKEMLARGILMMHNIHQFNLFFSAIRCSIRKGEFDECRDRFLKYYSEAVLPTQIEVLSRYRPVQEQPQ
ncbi:tRNA-guanine(15) transglycosylase-like protein [Paraphysoderma sedebokerense]|nr:tRNA-guanine(15) transglycosylase-like protein [Paraphysoderma sedebokerense]